MCREVRHRGRDPGERSWQYTATARPIHRFYWGLSLASLVLYFVTSSDSGSLVIDCLTANGNPHPPILQRIFWSATEGAVAMALLKAGGTNGLQALQAVSIIAGLPYSFVISFMCWALWTTLSAEYDAVHHIEREVFHPWATALIDVLDYPTFTVPQARKTAAAFFMPFLFAAKGAAWADGVQEVQYIAVYGTLFCSWVALLVFNTLIGGLWVVSWLLYLAFALHMAYERSNMRQLRVCPTPPPGLLPVPAQMPLRAACVGTSCRVLCPSSHESQHTAGPDAPRPLTA